VLLANSSLSLLSEEKIALLDAMIVDKASCNNTIKRSFLKYITDSCMKKGYHKVVVLEEEMSASKLYESLGHETLYEEN